MLLTMMLMLIFRHDDVEDAVDADDDEEDDDDDADDDADDDDDADCDHGNDEGDDADDFYWYSSWRGKWQKYLSLQIAGFWHWHKLRELRSCCSRSCLGFKCQECQTWRAEAGCCLGAAARDFARRFLAKNTDSLSDPHYRGGWVSRNELHHSGGVTIGTSSIGLQGSRFKNFDFGLRIPDILSATS